MQVTLSFLETVQPKVEVFLLLIDNPTNMPVVLPKRMRVDTGQLIHDSGTHFSEGDALQTCNTFSKL